MGVCLCSASGISAVVGAGRVGRGGRKGRRLLKIPCPLCLKKQRMLLYHRMRNKLVPFQQKRGSLLGGHYEIGNIGFFQSAGPVICNQVPLLSVITADPSWGRDGAAEPPARRGPEQSARRGAAGRGLGDDVTAALRGLEDGLWPR